MRAPPRGAAGRSRGQHRRGASGGHRNRGGRFTAAGRGDAFVTRPNCKECELKAALPATLEAAEEFLGEFRQRWKCRLKNAGWFGIELLLREAGPIPSSSSNRAGTSTGR